MDLSNNRLTSLGKNFAQLTFLIKLDLSKNQLKTLPDNFGDLVSLKHLDLYSNQLNHLPLSFGQLKSLKWLDLKNNPLVPPLAEVAGPCQDNQQCQQCARKVVRVISEAKQRLEEEQKKLAQLQREKDMAEKAAKKEQQQQKSKKGNKNEKKKNQENGVKNHNEHNVHESNTSSQKKKDRSNKSNAKSAPKQKPQSKCKTICWVFFLFATFISTTFGFLYLVDIEKYVQIRDGAGYVWNRTIDALPDEFVAKGKQAVEYVRPTAEWAFVKVHGFANSTSTFLNTDPRVKDHWNNIKEISSVICERLIDYLRTVYQQIPVYYNDVKNRVFN